MSSSSDINDLKEDFDDFFDNALSGYIITTSKGIIIRANKVFAKWLNKNKEELNGKRFQDLLTVGSKIYYETHLWPLLHVQGFFDEIAMELAAPNPGENIPVLIHAIERKSDGSAGSFIRLTVFKASDRRRYEDALKRSNTSLEASLEGAIQIGVLRDQLIGVLGHDLRNPLGSIIMGASALSSLSLSESEQKIIKIIQRSSARMSELIGNIMDFARTRLGEGIIIKSHPTQMEPVLQHVVDELRAIWPSRIITTDFFLQSEVDCDAPRIAQLASNLVANAIVHGSADAPVAVNSSFINGVFKLEISNAGTPIATQHIESLFDPFTRESPTPSQHGLGLGLYIAAQISKAHGGRIDVKSTDELTSFTFILQPHPR